MQELERDQNLPVIIADRKPILWKLEKSTAQLTGTPNCVIGNIIKSL